MTQEAGDTVWALRKYVEAKLEDLEGQVERRITTGTRELEEVRSYFNGILVEKDRAVEMADSEREKAASVLRDALMRTISEGDERLREHISHQVQQIQSALESAGLLEQERIDAVRTTVEALFAEKQKALDAALTAQKEAVSKAELATDRIAARAAGDQDALRGEMTERLAAVRRELEQATAAQKEAVIKQEDANERRFESVNEWRAQSADRERSQAEERNKLQSTFMLKEVADTQLDQIRKTADSRYEAVRELIAGTTSRVDGITGKATGAQDQRVEQRAVTTSQVGMLAVGLTVVWIMIAAISVAIAIH